MVFSFYVGAKDSCDLFDHMRESCVVPNHVSMVITVNACVKLGTIHKAKLVHEVIRTQ